MERTSRVKFQFLVLGYVLVRSSLKCLSAGAKLIDDNSILRISDSLEISGAQKEQRTTRPTAARLLLGSGIAAPSFDTKYTNSKKKMITNESKKELIFSKIVSRWENKLSKNLNHFQNVNKQKINATFSVIISTCDI